MKRLRLSTMVATVFCIGMLLSCSENNDMPPVEPNNPDNPTEVICYEFDQNNIQLDHKFHEIEIAVTNADKLGDWKVTEFATVVHDPEGYREYNREYVDKKGQENIVKIDASKFVLRMGANLDYARKITYKFESIDGDAVGYLVVNQESSDKPGYIWDYAPIYFSFYLYNEQGENLVKRMNKEQLEKVLTVAIWGKEYTFEDGKSMPTRMIPPTWTGLSRDVDRDGVAFLRFGELEGGAFFRDEEILLKWSDGSTDKILFSTHIEEAGVIKSSNSLNGITQEDRRFHFVKNL